MFKSRSGRFCLVVSTLFAMIILGNASAQKPSSEETHPEIAADIEAFVKKVMDRFEVPGLTIAVTEGKDIAYLGAFGVRSLETKEPMKPEYLFHMASVSKTLVATAVLQLEERGKLDLDDTVRSYLPYFELDDPRCESITIRQMLNHTSGMPDVRDYEWDKPQYDEEAAERYVRSLTTETMIFDPGEDFRYSNMAFDTLGDLIAKVSGKSFEAYMKKNILDPIGMHESTFLYPETKESLRTTPHVWQAGPLVSAVYPYNRRHAPSSTLNSSVVEMTNWAFVNLNRGMWNGQRILSEEGQDLLWTPSVDVGNGGQVGLSWFLGEHRERRTISHAGGDTGYRSHFTLLPEEEIGLILASNYDMTPMGSIREGILDILMGHDPQLPKRQITYEFGEVCFTAGFEAAKEHYLKLYEESQDEYLFDDRQLNLVGYQLMGRGLIDDALAVFRFNAERYPDVANVWDSLGEAHMTKGEKDKAIECYQKALDLDPEFDNPKKMLERLGVESK